MARARKRPALHVVEGGGGGETDVDALYGAPLEEFVRERNRIAAALVRDGRRDEAAEVRAIPKPAVSAWTVNQLARRRRAEMDALLAAGDALRRAQLGGDGFAEAQRAERGAISTLLRRAEEILAAAGRPATRATLDRIAATLRAGAVDEEGRALLAAGRLREDIEPSGFEALAGLAVPKRARSRARPATPRGDDQRERLARARGQVREARAREREARRAAHEAERSLEQAERAAADARDEAERRRAEAAEAAEAVVRAEAAVEAARR